MKPTNSAKGFYEQIRLFKQYETNPRFYEGNIAKIKAIAEEARERRLHGDYELVEPNFPYDPEEFAWSEACKRFRMLEEKLDELEEEEENGDKL